MAFGTTFFILAFLSIINLGIGGTILRKDNIDERGDFYQGDIVLSPSGRAGIINGQWENAQIIFELSPEFNNQDEINKIYGAIHEIEQNTCLRFIQRTDQRDFILITRERSGCWSYVGKIGRSQRLNLQPGNPGCINHGTILHEFLHAIGFFHEQSRPDRDDYVEINWPNVLPGAEHNFRKHDEIRNDGVPYDFESIMHYSAYAFAKDRNTPTIYTKPSGIEIGLRGHLSEKDILQINKMYCHL